MHSLCDGQQIVSVDNLSDLGVLLIQTIPARPKQHFPVDIGLSTIRTRLARWVISRTMARM